MATKRLIKEMVGIAKQPTGVPGLDDVRYGGVPKGRSTLVVGGPGSGKTVLGMEFLIRGARDYGEPGVCMSFEESADQLIANSSAMGHKLKPLIDSGKLLIDYVEIERREIEETGEYDLEGLFIRLGEAIRRSKAKRVLLDTIEVLFSGLQNTAILRAELRRLFRWLTDRGMTAMITAETAQGTHALPRYGLVDYVADCVIMLDHRVNDQVSTRRLRVMKYRGSPHGTNEYPFLMEPSGISVFPITSAGLTHNASTDRISTAISA